MRLLLITAVLKDRNIVESSLLENGFLEFHSILKDNNFLLWQSKLELDAIILFLPQAERNEVEKLISATDPSTKIILASRFSFPKYSNVINLEGSDYLAELISFLKNYRPSKNLVKDDILIKISDKYKRVRSSDILYLQADGKYITLNLGSRSYSIRSSLKSMEMILPDSFLRIHASFIVNTDKIESIHLQDQNVELVEGNIPFSRKYKSNILERFYLG